MKYKPRKTKKKSKPKIIPRCGSQQILIGNDLFDYTDCQSLKTSNAFVTTTMYNPTWRINQHSPVKEPPEFTVRILCHFRQWGILRPHMGKLRPIVIGLIDESIVEGEGYLTKMEQEQNLNVTIITIQFSNMPRIII